MRKILLLCILNILSISLAQERLNVLITVDDVISRNIYDSYLIINNDTIKLEYAIGRFIIAKEDHTTLKEGSNKNSKLYLKYRAFCPEVKQYDYIIDLNTRMLLLDYFLLKIYNYETYPKAFPKAYLKRWGGYGYAYVSPLGSLGIPNIHKLERNPCME